MHLMPSSVTSVHPAIRSYTVTEARQVTSAAEARNSCTGTSCTEIESLAVKLTGRRSKATVVVCVYRPPGTVTSTFTHQLSNMLDQSMLLDNRFVVVGDFKVPRDAAGHLDSHTVGHFQESTW